MIDWQGLDSQIFLFIQGFVGNPLVDQIFLYLAEFLVLFVPISLIYMWFESEESRFESIFILISTVAGILFTYVMGVFYFHNQPFSTYSTIVGGGELNNAFPSQHTATMFSCFWCYVYLKRKRLTYLFGVTGLLTGFGRVFVGLHYPFDIVGGIVSGLVGLLIGLGISTTFEDYLKKLVNFSYILENRIKSFCNRYI